MKRILLTKVSSNFQRILGFGINSHVLIFDLVEILDEEEFGQAATSVEYDDSTINSAAELGLLVSS